jgi:uncharacterized protein YaaQ
MAPKISRVEEIILKAHELAQQSSSGGFYTEESRRFLLGLTEEECEQVLGMAQKLFEARWSPEDGVQAGLMIAFQAGLEIGVAAQMTMPEMKL